MNTQGGDKCTDHVRCSGMRKILLLVLATASMVTLGAVQTVHAGGNIIVHRSGSVHFGNHYGLGSRWAWGPFSLNRSLGYIPTPPYFALHPPVYYSHSVAVPYGMSPYPIVSYSPVFEAMAQRPMPEPQVVINPYVDQDTVADEAEEARETAPFDTVNSVVRIEDAAGNPLQPDQQPLVVENPF